MYKVYLHLFRRHKTRWAKDPQVKQLLGYVTAAVVGVILNLTIYLSRAVVFPGGILAHPDYASLT